MRARTRSLAAWGLALLLAAGLAACAAAGAGGGEGGNTTVVVENDLVPTAALTIYAVPERGGRRLIGTLSPGETRTLRFEVFGAGGQYRFVAENTAGSSMMSNPVTIRAGDTVRWTLQSNIAIVSDPA